jgi:hypothetical protein
VRCSLMQERRSLFPEFAPSNCQIELALRLTMEAVHAANAPECNPGIVREDKLKDLVKRPRSSLILITCP